MNGGGEKMKAWICSYVEIWARVSHSFQKITTFSHIAYMDGFMAKLAADLS